jgi:hypothetical protein
MKLIAIGACAALLFATACSDGNRTSGGGPDNTPAARADIPRNPDAATPSADTTTPSRVDQTPAPEGTSKTSEAEQQPITAAGCLQQDGRDYILTELSEPTAGPADVKGDGSKVEREQVNAAEHAYRLTAAKGVNDDDWKQLVGKKVKVEGTVTKAGEIGTSGTSGHREKIREGDLADVDVTRMQLVANACGGRAGRRRH